MNAYATGTLVCKEHADHGGVHTEPGDEAGVRGHGGVERTSFSTALFAGMVAARKSHTGETAREAAEAL